MIPLELKWIKLCIDMFDNRKIKHIRKMPEGNNIVLIWMMLLTMAGRCNANGFIFLTEEIPYTPKMLADELDFDESVIQIALTILEKFQMIQRSGDEIMVQGWSKYQNIDGMERIREQTRNRVSKYRENQKKIDSNATCNVTVTERNATEKEKEVEEDKEKDISTSNEVSKKPDGLSDKYHMIQDMFNSVCGSYPCLVKMSEARKKAIKARLNTGYNIDDFLLLFKKAEASDFLKGKNDRNWSATFDWLISDKNMAKTLDGNYDNKQNSTMPKPANKNKFNNFPQRQYDFNDIERQLLGK